MNNLVQFIISVLILSIISGPLTAQEERWTKEEVVEKGIKSVKTEYFQVSEKGLIKVKAEKFIYDERGNLIGREEFDKNGRLITSTQIKYDENDHQNYQRLIQHTQNKVLEVSWQNSYENGKLTEVKNSNTPAIKTFEYDEDGRVIVQKDIDATGEVFGLRSYEYDQKGNIVNQKEVVEFLERTFNHTYNGLNQKTRTILTRNNTFEGGGKTVEMEDYSYNSKGQLAKTVFRDNSGGVKAFSQFYYDKSGKLIREEKEDIQYLYKYDEYGNMIEKKKTKKGKVQLVEKIIYEL